HADVSRPASGKIDDSKSDLISARFQMLLPKLVKLFRQSGKRVFPTGLTLIYGATTIGAQLIRKASNLDLSEAVVRSSFDDCRGACETLLVRNTRGFRKSFDQPLFLSFGSR